MSDFESEQQRWEELRAPGLEPAAPDDFVPGEGEDDGFKVVAADGV